MNRWLAPLIFGLLLLTGCGQKGDLYIPDQPKHSQS
ncbi:MAG: lipoprotein [Motiliproteus sp.]